MNANISFLYEVRNQYNMTFLYEVYRLIPENIKTKSLLKTSDNKMRVSLGSLCFDSPRGVN